MKKSTLILGLLVIGLASCKNTEKIEASNVKETPQEIQKIEKENNDLENLEQDIQKDINDIDQLLKEVEK